MRTILASLTGALALAVTLLAAAPQAAAQTAQATEAKPRPKIGLVLSGGGARGAAHVGVLKVLEEMRVPVDYIAGTSMGSIVGGSYATGTTIPEMEEELARIKTVDLFTDTPPRKDIPVRRKQEDRQIFFGPELGFNKWALQLPKGAISGIALEAELRRLVALKGPRNFNELPIPFRAVATDIVTGLPHVFDDGEVAVAMRASMSIPGAVAPAAIGDHLYVDGGLVNNLPVDVARAMGADIVIAVNLGTPLLRGDQITSIVGVVEQMINILTEQNVRLSLASLKPEDILILPELGDFSATDFDNLPKTVPIGEAAARKVADRLARYAVSPEEYAAWKAKRETENPPSGRPIDEIRVEGAKRVNPEVIVSTMDTKPGEPLDQAKLDTDLRRIYGRGDFEHLGYRVMDEQSKRILVVDAAEKSWGPNYLRFGLGLSTDFQGETYFNLLARYRSTWMNTLGGEFRADAQIGKQNLLAGEFYQPLVPNAYFFVAPNASVQSYPISLFSEGVKIAQYDVSSAQAGLDLGSQFTKYGELRLGAMAGQLKFSLDSGSLLFPRSETVQQGAFVGRLYIDQIDSLRFPRSGYVATGRVFASRSMLGAEDQYTRWDVDLLGAASFGRHALSLGARLGGKIGSDALPFYDAFQWGGFLQMSGYRTGEILAEQLQFGRLVYTYKLADIPLLEGVYLGGSAEISNVSQPLIPGSPKGFLKSGSLFIALDSPIGPLYFAYGKAFDGEAPSSFYFFLGLP